MTEVAPSGGVVYSAVWSPACLSGKTAIVTGASGGVGAEIALGLSDAGAKVYGLTRSPDRIPSDSPVIAMEADAGSEGDIRQAVKSVARQEGGVDVAVANAARYTTLEFEHLDSSAWSLEMVTNLSGAFYLFSAVSESMLERKSGSMIAIGSTAGQRGGSHGHVAYGASKAGLEGLCKGIARELGPHGIRANVVALGSISGTRLSAEVERIRPGTHGSSNSLRRAGTVSEAAHAVVYLASDGSSFITGAVLRVDGGGLYSSP